MNSSSQKYISKENDNQNKNQDISFEETPLTQVYNFQLRINQKTSFRVNFTLQIFQIKKIEKYPSLQNSERNNDIFNLTLSDEDYFLPGFILLVHKNEPLLEVYDLIDVYDLVIIPNIKNNQKLLHIKDFKLVKKLNYLLGQPKRINKNHEEEQYSGNYSNNQNCNFNNNNNNICIIFPYFLFFILLYFIFLYFILFY
jgi:hypothetical protein